MMAHTRVSFVPSIFLAGIAAFNLGCSATGEGDRSAANRPASPPSTNLPATPTPLPADRISLADAKREYDSGNAIFIDTRSREVYEMQRLPGALSIQTTEIDANINKLPKGKRIIVYCS